MSFSFRPSHKLRYSWEYKKFFSGSEVLRLSEMVIFRMKNNLPHPRLGITIKAKVNSVYRNKIKRKIREFFRKNKEAFGAYDYNFVISTRTPIDHLFVKKIAVRLDTEFLNATHRFKPSR